MAVNLSIKGVPDALAERLRDRAKRHHRSLQGELMAIIEAAATGDALSIASGPPAPQYRAAATLSAHGIPSDGLLGQLDADLRGATLSGGPWLSREAVHDRSAQSEAAANSNAARPAQRKVRKGAQRG